nr:MAG: dihydrofolate reductase [Candidatus Nanosalinarum sp. J07AB56]
MEKVVVVATDEDNVIGEKGEIPWHHPEDLRHFRDLTIGHPVIMGRSTYESLPDSHRPLPERTNVVLTRSGLDSEELGHDSVQEANSLQEAFSISAELSDTVFIGGGETVYEQTLEDADRIELTRIHDTHGGDTFFPEPGDEWVEASREDGEQLSFVTLRRR